MIKAKFTDTIKEAMLERDGACVICGQQGIDCHHVYFGISSNYSIDRNNIDQGVLLCRKHHDEAHSCKSGEGVRQECIDYLLSISEYGNMIH